MRQLLIAFALLPLLAFSQTYYYIDGISVSPPAPNTDDAITITLHGNLSSSGAFIVSTSHMLMGNTVHITVDAADPGGLAVLVPHDEEFTIGTLAAGDYTFVINGQGVLDLAPTPQHLFTVTEGGSACDHLAITSIQWHAFTDTAIVLHASNTNMNSELFDYPSFLLLGMTGDTLAKETVNLFGIGEDSWHFLRVMDDADIPSGPFSAVLELWTDFDSVLVCTWEMVVDLCPPAPCAPLIATVQNYGGALAIGSYDWIIYDADFVIAAGGTFTMDAETQLDYDTLCIPPGHYWMACDPNDPPTGGQPVFGVLVDHWIQGPFQPVVWSLPMAAEFDFFMPCAQGTNNVAEEVTVTGFMLLQTSGTVTLQRTDGNAIGSFSIMDAQGRLLDQGTTTASSIVLPKELRSGVILIRVGDSILRAVVVKD